MSESLYLKHLRNYIIQKASSTLQNGQSNDNDLNLHSSQDDKRAEPESKTDTSLSLYGKPGTLPTIPNTIPKFDFVHGNVPMSSRNVNDDIPKFLGFNFTTSQSHLTNNSHSTEFVSTPPPPFTSEYTKHSGPDRNHNYKSRLEQKKKRKEIRKQLKVNLEEDHTKNMEDHRKSKSKSKSSNQPKTLQNEIEMESTMEENLIRLSKNLKIQKSKSPVSVLFENTDETGSTENLTLLALQRSREMQQFEEDKINLKEKEIQQKKYDEENRKQREWNRKKHVFVQFRESLPIFKHKNELLQLLEKNQVVVVVGETGSGKTTQITQYLHEAGYGDNKKIGCTQPRRVAAKTVAKRVSMEFGTDLGDKVGYKVRFDNKAAPNTIIVYMTDGLLVRELCSEPNAEPYSVIMLDEAHERSIHTDVAMGLLKEVLKRRKDLIVLVTSATLDAGKFSKYFNGAPVLNIPGRVFPVDICYSYGMDPDYFLTTITTINRIHKKEDPGDILVFLTGEDEIETACEMLSGIPDMLPLPMYSALPWDMQSVVFEPAPKGKRKVVIATNLAETSVTIDGIVYVVDPGYVKQREYNPKTGIDNLVVKLISRAQAIQRAGRAGRTQPGKVFRLYTERTFNTMIPLPIPEIQRVNVESVILQLASMGITDILNFNFMDAPSVDAITTGVEHLIDLGAFKDSAKHLELTKTGKEMSGFPLEPSLAKVLIKSHQIGCGEEILIIVALLSTQNQSIFIRPKKIKLLADQTISKFHDPKGDHITFLNVYKEWKFNNYSRRWCKENFIQSRSLEEAEEIKGQLACLMTERNLNIVSCHGEYSKVQQAICSGFFQKLAKRLDRGHGYATFGAAGSEKVFIHPSSSVFKTNPLWVIYHEVIKTKQVYMRQVMEIQPKWLSDQSPTFFNKLTKRFPELVVHRR